LFAAAEAPPEDQPAVLYLGTHAFVAQGKEADPLDSFIALARTGDGGVGADGRLRARDILGRRIPGDIAVLAACTTGWGKPTGDGVVGLSRAFLTAGPTTLVLTLSAVGLHSSLELTSGFHAGLRDGHASRARALAGAQRELKAEGQQVETWSSFVLFGAP
jgi:CHAT domain-containing protein